MDKNVNFLKSKVAALKRKKAAIFILSLGSFSVLALFVIATLALFSYNFILKRESAVLKDKFELKKNEINEYQAIESKQAYLKKKVSSLKEIIASQRQNQQIAEAVFNLLPEGISITGFVIDVEGGVGFSASSKDFKSLKNFITSLETTSQIGDLRFKKIMVRGINYSYEKGYNLSLYLSFK